MSTRNAKSGAKPTFNFNFADLEEKDESDHDSVLRKKPSSKGISDADKIDVDDDLSINIPENLQA